MQQLTKEAELRSACYDVARSTMWDQRPVDVDEIGRVAESFYAVAKEAMLYLEEERGVGDFVLRAVHYLEGTHAIPPMRDDIHWFRDMLAVLIELVSPSSEPSPRNALFYRDLLRGLADTLASVSAPDESGGSHGGS